MNPEDIYQINNDNHTYTTLTEQPGTYAGSPDVMRLDLGQRVWEKYDVDTADDDCDEVSNVNNLTNITDYLKRDLYNKLKDLEISMMTQSSCTKEGTTFDLPSSQQTWTEGSTHHNKSKSQQK